MEDKHFYIHIIDMTPLYERIDTLHISGVERRNLIMIAESHIHQAIIDAVLTELAEEDKPIFLEHLDSNNHQSIWDMLTDKIEDVEDKIVDVAHRLRDELIGDI